MSSIGILKAVFYKNSKLYRSPHARELGKRRMNEEIFFLQNQNNIGKKNIICEIYSLIEEQSSLKVALDVSLEIQK